MLSGRFSAPERADGSLDLDLRFGIAGIDETETELLNFKFKPNSVSVHSIPAIPNLKSEELPQFADLFFERRMHCRDAPWQW